MKKAPVKKAPTKKTAAKKAPVLMAKVVAYEGMLVLSTTTDKSIKDKCHLSSDNPTCIGQMIMDTKRHLGVSKDALTLLENVKRGRDAIGDVDWFRVDNGKHAFGWLGGLKVIKDPSKIEGSSTYRIGEHVTIPNVVPKEAAEVIDGMKKATKAKGART